MGWACVARLSFCFEKTFIGASYQISVHLATRFQRRFFLNNPPKICLWWPCLLTDRDEMSIFIEDLPWLPLAILVSDWSMSKKSSPLKPLGQMNQNMVGSIYGRSSIKMLISSRSVNKHGHHRQFLFLIGQFFLNLLLWNHLAKWTETW